MSQPVEDFGERPTLPPDVPRLDGWFVVELLGHRSVTGKVTEQLIAGVPFLRIDIPWADPAKGARATQYYRPTSVYCITPCEESHARDKAREWERYEPATTPQLPAPAPTQQSDLGRGDDHEDPDW